MADNDLQAIVIDNGSGSIKAGYAGDDAPRTVFSTVVGRPKMPGIMVGMDEKDSYVGNEAIEKHGVLQLNNPIQRGLVTNWDDMEKVWLHTFYNTLKVVPDEHPVLLTECPLNPILNREKTTQIMFENFNVPAMSIGMQAVMALYTSGRTTGCVVDIGHGVSHVVPVFEGYALPHVIQRTNVAGDDVTEYLLKLLGAKGYRMTTAGEKELVKSVKENLCYVARDYDRALAAASGSAVPELSYTLPDGSKITLAEEAFRAPEVLFKPSLLGLNNERGLREAIGAAIASADQDTKKDIFSSVVLAGGSTLFKDFAERLDYEISMSSTSGAASSAPGAAAAGGAAGGGASGLKSKIIAAPERQYGVWIGASILASLSTFHQLWMSKADYDEYGPTMVHRKCL